MMTTQLWLVNEDSEKEVTRKILSPRKLETRKILVPGAY